MTSDEPNDELAQRRSRKMGPVTEQEALMGLISVINEILDQFLEFAQSMQGLAEHVEDRLRDDDGEDDWEQPEPGDVQPDPPPQIDLD